MTIEELREFGEQARTAVAKLESLDGIGTKGIGLYRLLTLSELSSVSSSIRMIEWLFELRKSTIADQVKEDLTLRLISINLGILPEFLPSVESMTIVELATLELESRRLITDIDAVSNGSFALAEELLAMRRKERVAGGLPERSPRAARAEAEAKALNALADELIDQIHIMIGIVKERPQLTDGPLNGVTID